MKISKKDIIIVLLLIFSPNSVVYITGQAPQQQVVNVDHKIMQKALNSAINGNMEFYTSKPNEYLANVIAMSEYILARPMILALYKKDFGLTIPELKKLFNKVIKHSTQAIALKKEEQQLKLQLQAAQLKIPQPQPKIIVVKKQPAQEACPVAPKTYSIYIMLDVHNFNTKKQPIHWKHTINNITSKMQDAVFSPDSYHHITLAWYESKEPFTKEHLAKVEKALTRANEILMIVYPYGAGGIAFLDSALLLGKKKNVVAFRVAESTDLQKIQRIILKFLSYENAGVFRFANFQKETPLHLTLGRKNPQKKGANLKM